MTHQLHDENSPSDSELLYPFSVREYRVVAAIYMITHIIIPRYELSGLFTVTYNIKWVETYLETDIGEL